MRYITLILAALISQQALADQLTDGQYSGEGISRAPEGDQAYKVTTLIKGHRIESSYLLANGRSPSWNFDRVSGANGAFVVKSHGLEVGTGYCLKHAPVCHYEIQINEFKLEETLTLQGDKLYKFGSKTSETGRVQWEEALARN